MSGAQIVSKSKKKLLKAAANKKRRYLERRYLNVLKTLNPVSITERMVNAEGKCRMKRKFKIRLMNTLKKNMELEEELADAGGVEE
ncbi:MAG: hypothetical protein Hyperionvirus13_36 [Hyperionvirus sp.]|uniref:Uncharacterized protein n=1 Tax=Hyperionvirus sp. TaxID=2487770 RepID=A0A3G5ADC2_9VIRU|nr:MAG: hypothetical protein Hyperionvirus13_36 [Hyperionvirus sp.]